MQADFTAANAYTFQARGNVGRDSTRSFFVRVPQGASALRVDLTGGGSTPGSSSLVVDSVTDP